MQFEGFKDAFSLDSMNNHQQYMHQRSSTYSPSMPAYRNVPYSRNDNAIASTSSNPGGSAPGASLTGGTNSGLPQSSFRAPAHKHAHHLHSIPPREKSTRTLIIDHMLWVHGRTRFAQARAELGMSDRTGGPTSPNYVHRSRPESYEEEDEEGSEGEDIVALKARAGGPGHPHDDDEDERRGRQDLLLARSLRLRAEGLEKVVISMLEQIPLIHPINDEEILTPPTSPKINATSSTQPHRLPNGVRLRLALGTIINDLFARQAPPPPYRHTRAPGTKIATPPDHSPSVIPSPSDLPDALATLAPVSGAFAPLPQSSQGPPRSMQSPQYGDYQSNYSNSGHQNYNQSSSPRMHMQYHSMQQQQPLGPPPPPRTQRPHPNARTRSLYAVGADPSTANSPPAFRCPRHLHTGCEICVEAKLPPRQSGSSNSRGRVSSFSTDRASSSNSWKAMPGGVGPGGGGITGWQDGSGIGSGLLRPGVKGSVLRRKIREDGDSTAGAGNTKLSKLIPRFIRLSALVAAELGREARGEEDGTSDDGQNRREESIDGSAATPRSESGWTPGPPSPSISRATARGGGQQPQMQNRMYEFALRPSSEWYMLLAGLLTRAALEGYLTAGWTGLQAVQCLLLVGLGINENAWKNDDGCREEDDDEEFSSLDPDELPTLVEAIRILFPNLRQNGSGLKSKGEEEYEVEMLERLKRFYDIPASTPDCATHMEDLAWQYPAEPVERAAVRFCEAIAKWRGKPELETYKKKPAPPLDVPSTPGGSAVMTIESLVHSNPTSPIMPNAAAGTRRKRRLVKPSIDVYFMQTLTMTRPRGESGTWNRNPTSPNMNTNKRYRDSDDVGRMDPSKRHYT